VNAQRNKVGIDDLV